MLRAKSIKSSLCDLSGLFVSVVEVFGVIPPLRHREPQRLHREIVVPSVADDFFSSLLKVELYTPVSTGHFAGRDLAYRMPGESVGLRDEAQSASLCRVGYIGRGE